MNDRTSKNLASRLLYLPLDLSEKVLLWLTYKGIKPVSELTITRRKYKALGSRKIESETINKNNKIRIKNWIRDADLFYVTEETNSNSWHVGRDKDKIKLSIKILYRLDFESEYRSGVLFGYPPESVKAYAHNRNLNLGGNLIAMISPGLKFIYPYLKNKYYTPYILYSIREDKIIEEITVARQWADTIRKDLPNLAKWYEKSVAQRRTREDGTVEMQKLKLSRGRQTVDEIIREYAIKNKTTRQIFDRAIEEFIGNIINEFQFASICYELRRWLKPSEKKDRRLVELLGTGKNIYRKEKKLKQGNLRARVKLFLDLLNDTKNA